ncbi:MAG: Flp family type IVb pilin [Rhodospirillales bacterium]|nr:Flp family type IVb pilin [Rhodospirillales bacterium]
MHQISKILSSLRADRRGVTALEYGLIAAAIIVAISATVFSLGSSLNGSFSSVNTSLTGPAASTGTGVTNSGTAPIN